MATNIFKYSQWRLATFSVDVNNQHTDFIAHNTIFSYFPNDKRQTQKELVYPS